MEIAQANVIAIKIISDDFKSRPTVYLNEEGELDASKFALAVNKLANNLEGNCVTLSRPQLQLLLTNMD